jgi:diguanylate cyclase (GGDEF)-like protein
MKSSNRQIVLKVDENHFVEEVLLNTDPEFEIGIGTPVAQILDSESYLIYFDTFQTYESSYQEVGRKVMLRNQDEAFMFHLFTDKNILFIIGFDQSASMLFERIMEINNSYVNVIRNLRKQLSERHGETDLLEEFMKINNELINTKRELSYRNKDLEDTNYVDFLTRINNRRKFFFDIYRFVKQKDYLLIMMDFNEFKLINDLYGHNKGDETLVLFSKRLKEEFALYNGVVYRLGGDEFAVLVDDVDPEKIKFIFDKLDGELRTIHKKLGIAYGHTVVTSSNCNQYMKAEMSMKIVDRKMYEMKMKSKQK